MSDFLSDGWGLFVTAVTLAGILGCALLLWMTGRRQVGAPGETTGHVWDGDLQEYNNPMPRWWMWLFYITIVFSIGYLVLYPGLGRYQGAWNWSQVSQYEREVEAYKAQIKPLYDAFAAQDVPQLAGDARAMGVGERLFLNNCAQCHGSDARGAKGFPNLADTDWLYGGTPEAIKTSITQGRHGVMPPMAAAVGGEEDLQNLVQYVLSLSGSASDPVKANLGKPKFAACAACHGADGKGNVALGAPNLTDKVWLYGGGAANVLETIRKGRGNQMPAQADKLAPEQIHVLSAYVWSLSNKARPVATSQVDTAVAGTAR